MLTELAFAAAQVSKTGLPGAGLVAGLAVKDDIATDGTVTGGLTPAPPNSTAETTPFEPTLVLVMRAITCPLRFQTRYSPPVKFEAFIEFRIVPLPASRISMR